MKIEIFNKILYYYQEKIRELAIGKNKEYARDEDKLHNFKRTSEVRRRIPERCLEAMMSKHTINIYDMLDDLEKNIHHPIELWNEKINDNILYLHLLRALLIERYNIDLTDKLNLDKISNTMDLISTTLQIPENISDSNFLNLKGYKFSDKIIKK